MQQEISVCVYGCIMISSEVGSGKGENVTEREKVCKSPWPTFSPPKKKKKKGIQTTDASPRS